MKPAANVSFLFTEVPLPERFQAARQAGFEGVEILFPYDHAPEELRAAAAAAGVRIVLINTPAGDREAGEAGHAALPMCESDFRAHFATALEYARTLRCERIHVLSGKPPADTSAEQVLNTLVGNLRWAADLAAQEGITLLVEPLNRYDFPGYAVSTPEQAAEVLARVERANVGLQFDLYHTQIMGGDITRRLRKLAPLIRHVQISSVPGRGEPDRGEVNLEHVLRTLAALGYNGWISGEYRPENDTVSSLRWLRMLEDIRAA